MVLVWSGVWFGLIDFGIVGVGTLFPDSSYFFPQGFHCTGFNEVDGNGVMVVLYFVFAFGPLESLSARRGGVSEKLLGAGGTALLPTRVEWALLPTRVERAALLGERTPEELKQGAEWGQSGEAARCTLCSLF